MRIIRNLLWFLLCLCVFPWVVAMVFWQRWQEQREGYAHWGTWWDYLRLCIWWDNHIGRNQ